MIDCLVHLPKLNLKISPTYVKADNLVPYYCVEYKFEDVFSTETVDLFKNIGLLQYVRGVQLFRSLGLENRNIHIDGTHPEISEGVINWVPDDPDDSDWSTDFFDVNLEKKISSDQKYNLGSKITFNEDDCKLAVSWTGPSRSPVLMRVNVPHRIQNRKNQERWCYSIRFKSRLLDYYGLKNILANYQ